MKYECMMCRNKRMNVEFSGPNDDVIHDGLMRHAQGVYPHDVIVVDMMTDQIDVYLMRDDKRIKVATYMAM